MVISLIGYRGTGKTTVARLLAKRLDWQWIDADVEVERRAGQQIVDIFAQAGESAFRQLESEVVSELVGLQRYVLALGGGVVLRDENRRALTASRLVIWLRADPHVLQQRLAVDTATDGQRPDLTPFGGLDEITQLLAARTPLYRQCAQLAIDTDNKSPQAVADEIYALLPSDVVQY